MGFLDDLKKDIGLGKDEEDAPKVDTPAPAPSLPTPTGGAAPAPAPAPTTTAAAEGPQTEAPPAPWDPQVGHSAPVPAPAAVHHDAPKPAAPKPHRTYTVKSGDNLTEIAEKFGVDYRDIARINHIKNPDLIYPGQVFTIPG